MVRVDDAFVAEQYRLHATAVFRRCLAMSGGDARWAEDVTHDVFLRLMEKADTVDRSKPLAGWLLTVANRLCIDRIRRERSWFGRIKARFEATRRAAGEPEATPSEALLARLRQSLAQLPTRERTVLAMKYFEGVPQKQIAVVLGCSEGRVSQLAKRGLERLRAMGWEAEDD